MSKKYGLKPVDGKYSYEKQDHYDDFDEQIELPSDTNEEIKSSKSITTKLSLILGICILITITILVVYTSISRIFENDTVLTKTEDMTSKNTKKHLELNINKEAKKITNKIDIYSSITKSLATSFATSKMTINNNSLTRENINLMLKNILKQNKELLGIYTLWEPNAFDGLDAQYINTKGHDNTGRFIPYWSRDSNDKLKLTPLEDYNNHEKHSTGVRKGEYYLKPKETKKTSVIDPYPYEVQGKTIHLTSIVSPIIVNNKFYGIVGVDISIDFLNTLMVKLNKQIFEGKGISIILTKNKTVAGASINDDRLLGNKIDKIDGFTVNEKKIIIKNIENNKNGVISLDNFVYTSHSFKIDDNDNYWMISNRTPTNIVRKEIDELINEISDSSNRNIILSIIVGIIILIIGILVMFFIARGFSRPILLNIEAVKRVANGDFTEEINIKRDDEIGILANLINKVIRQLRKVEEFTISIRNGDFTQKMEALSEKDNLAPSLSAINDKLNQFKDTIEEIAEKIQIGKLTERTDLSDLENGYKDIAMNVNKLIDVFTAHFDLIPVPIAIIDENSTIQYVNKTSLIANDMTLEEFIGEKFSKIAKFKKNYSNPNADNIDLSLVAMKENRDITNEIQLGTNSGNFEALFTTAVLRDDNKNVKGTLNFFIDQTEIKKSARIMEKIADYQKREVDKLAKVLNQMAKGDLTPMYNSDSGDSDTSEVVNSFGSISRALNDSLYSLNSLLTQITSATEQITSASKEVSNNSQNLATGASEQASSLEEISASVNEVSGQTKNNADNATEANGIAKQTKDKAVKGNELMAEMLTAMNDIKDASNNISRIIKVIDEIAFQTNILSLNAAVEAARAGAHGKGFAVVADEVRNLAQRSAKAAKETTEMIEGTIIKIDKGSKLSDETAISLNEIVDAVDKVSKLVDDIASSSQEQEQGITQVTQALNQIEEVTQNTAASAEESSATSEELSSQAVSLKSMIDKFKIKEVYDKD